MKRLVTLPALLLGAALGLGARCDAPDLPDSGSALFLSPQARPLALSGDGDRLYAVNTAAGTLTVFDVSAPSRPARLAEIPVGLEPSGVAVRPSVPGQAELVLVTNHVSDSISVVDVARLDVVQTLQALDAEGVTATNEPTGVAFAGPNRAYVALDQPNELAVLEFDPVGRASLAAGRLAIRAQAPRAVAGDASRVFVAAFESGNQTEFPTCGPFDPRGLRLGHPWDEGCEYKLGLVAPPFGELPGRVILDRDLPDRDVFVFDAKTGAPLEVIEGIGTLLYGLALSPSGERLYVTGTDARNRENGLDALGNRVFENRVTVVDCAGGCDAGDMWAVDLDASAGVPVPTPHGIDVSRDGETLAVVAAGADGGTDMAGLVLLDVNGLVQGSVPVGALPQGVALRSRPDGRAETAFVLNVGDATLVSVDVSLPETPSLLASIPLGRDPVSDGLRRGRIAFQSARGSTGHTFACASCHPDGNIDQLLWTINAIGGPDDGPDRNGASARARNTQPVRGLRDTLPLHWDGSLGDPIARLQAEPPFVVPADCDPYTEGTTACFRHLVDASLGGVMCAQDATTPCAPGPSGLPGELDDGQRDDLARFLEAVSYPPSPARRPDDALSPAALAGLRDLTTDDDANGANHLPDGGGFDSTLVSCADSNIGCHALPLTTSTHAATRGAPNAPTFRGLWDRSLLTSNGFGFSEEALSVWQACADGSGPPGLCWGSFLVGLGPSGNDVWDPETGMTERGSFLATFDASFRLRFGIEGRDAWRYVLEQSVGFAGLTGRQLELTGANLDDPEIGARLARLEAAGREDRVSAVARNRGLGEFRIDPATGLWTGASGALAYTGAELRALAADLGVVVTITAELPEHVSPESPQPLLTTLGTGAPPPLPRPAPGGSASISAVAFHVESDASLWIDGARCDSCTLTLLAGEQAALARIGLDPVPDPGPHVIQVQNPRGLASNELPIVVE